MLDTALGSAEASAVATSTSVQTSSSVTAAKKLSTKNPQPATISSQAITSTTRPRTLIAAPESLVSAVRDGVNTLVTTMCIADKGTPINDKTLVDCAGGLTQWNVHTNLCCLTVNGAMRVVGVPDTQRACVDYST
jgi:hypothetical protein